MYTNLNVIPQFLNIYANFPKICPKPHKIVTISMGFQGVGEGIDFYNGF
ncbi:hypothetical protein [Dolichospermum sp. FACHB-1091]|nr:hypothetical protein [Dolichospermum sp. FACHB-1091]